MGQSVIRNSRKIHSQSGGDPNLITEINNFDKDKNNFRLTLTSGVAVTTTDVVNAQTIYCTPYNGNTISLYNGTNWVLYSSVEFSLALGTLSTGMYDVFCYANSGIPTLEYLAWTNDTTRATALVLQDGILCKTGALTRRYLGTFYNAGNKTATVTITNASPAVITYTGHGLTANAPVVFTTTGALPSGIVAGQTYYVASLGTATANTFNISATPGGVLINTSTAGSGTHTCTINTYTEDSKANRFLWNNYNQVTRQFLVKENLASWDYTTATYRQSNANKLNQVNFVLGLTQLVSVEGKTRCGNSTAGVGVVSSIGLDSITVPYISSVLTIPSAVIGNSNTISSEFLDYPSEGLHYLSLLEFSSATGTTRWYSGGGSVFTQIQGIILG